jgi:hypothetical protein
MPASQVAHPEGQHAEWDARAVRGGGMCVQTQIRALLQTAAHPAALWRHSLRDTPRRWSVLRGLRHRCTPQHYISRTRCALTLDGSVILHTSDSVAVLSWGPLLWSHDKLRGQLHLFLSLSIALYFSFVFSLSKLSVFCLPISLSLRPSIH